MAKKFSIPRALAIVSLYIGACWARVINVPSEYPTIQAGIDAAINGDTVLVAPGEYGVVTDNIIIENKNILLTSLPDTLSCRINGKITVRGAVDTTCVIRGLEVSPIRVYNASPIIEGNYIWGFWGDFCGGVGLENSNGIVRNNIIAHNIAIGTGGGVFASGNPIIEKNIISHNGAFSAEGYTAGGGVYLISGTVRHNLVIHNGASAHYGLGRGGGLYSTEGPCVIANNTIVDNGSWGSYYSSEGGGILFNVQRQGHEITFKNNLIAFNRLPEGIRAYIGDSTWTGWDYNLVFANDSLDYVGLSPGPHDIQADPMFVDTAAGDYRLLPHSPCIDAGDPASPLDPDGSRADIGAYYFDQAVGIDDPGPSGPYRFALAQSYPNPFNARTVISYSLKQSTTVSLLIYSITGQRVRTLAAGEKQEPGQHRYIWEGTDNSGKPVSTGIYFYELYVDDHRESKAMILIR